jgi:hypothetical protein
MVTLIDKYDVIIKIWHYLQNASPKDIESLPELNYGDKLPSSLTESEKYLLGYTVNRGNSTPCKTVNNWCNIPRAKKFYLKNLHKIKHWTVKLGSYTDIAEREPHFT